MDFELSKIVGGEPPFDTRTAREIELEDEIERLRAEVAALKAPVGMEPERGVSYFCNKCGYFGDSGPYHVKRDAEPCNYLAAQDGPWYSAAQLAQVQRARDVMENYYNIALERLVIAGKYIPQCRHSEFEDEWRIRRTTMQKEKE